MKPFIIVDNEVYIKQSIIEEFAKPTFSSLDANGDAKLYLEFENYTITIDSTGTKVLDNNGTVRVIFK